MSWFLHAHRDRLAPLHDRFVLYTDACFDLFAGRIIAVTGTYGKTTTSRFAATLTDGHLCGNDREFTFDLDALAGAAAEECLVFETSNRHLANGFRRVVDVGVVTGISLNHEPDHGSFEQYRATKYSMAERCVRLLYHVAIPQRFADAGALTAKGSSYGAAGAWSLSGTIRLRPSSAADANCQASRSSIRSTTSMHWRRLRRRCSAAPLRTTSDDVPWSWRQHDRAIDKRGEQRDGRTVINDAAACVPSRDGGAGRHAQRTVRPDLRRRSAAVPPRRVRRPGSRARRRTA